MRVLVGWRGRHSSMQGVAERIPDWLFFEAVGGRYGDFRDWAAIDAWSDRVAADLAARASES
ncbi:MAG: hypothetical protein AB7P40_31015 [Chloroflexota bacterium]